MTQHILVYLIVAAAVFYLVRTLWLASRGEKGCGSCSGTGECSAAKGAPSQPAPPAALVQITVNTRRTAPRPPAPDR